MKFLRKFHWFEILLIVVIMIVHLYAAFSAPQNFPTRWFTRDDAFYYFKVAQNISEGHGSTFDGINLTNGYHPLWMLICIPIFAFARLDLILPLRILMIVMAALSTSSSILLFRLLKKPAGELSAILAASFWAFSMIVHSIVTQQGMETGLVAFSILFFLYQLQRLETKPILNTKDQVILSVAGLFVLFSRLDGVFLILIAGVWFIFRKTPIRYNLPIDLSLTFFVIVGAFIQRASLKIYLLAFDSSAIFISIFTVIVQTIVFYLFGLYIHPKKTKPVLLIIQIVSAVTLTTLISFPLILLICKFTSFDLPRAIPIYYWLGMMILTTITRFSLRLISPWNDHQENEESPFQGKLIERSQLRLGLEPVAKWFRSGWIYISILGIGLGIYVGLNKFFFGTFMPVSGQIKRWWGSMPNSVYGGPANTLLDVYAIDPKYSGAWGLLTKPIYTMAQTLSLLHRQSTSKYYWLMICVVIIIFTAILLSNRNKMLRRIFLVGLIPLLISSELQAFFYGAMAYASTHEWYWVSQMLTVVILLSIAISGIRDILPKNKTFQKSILVLAGLFSLYMAYGFASEIILRMPYTKAEANTPYMDTMPILEGFTEPGALIGMTGGGNAGYFISGRTIVNMDGLINSYQYFEALKNNQGGKYLKKIGLKYIFANPYIITSSMPYRNQFDSKELIPVKGAPIYGSKELMHLKTSK